MMKTVSLSEITQIAENLLGAKQQWHFHLLTPSCKLNQKKEHAFVLEDISHDQIFVHYSIGAQMNLGKQLLKKLHGIDVQKIANSNPSSSAEMKKILDSVQHLTRQGKLWHHHMLLPQCIYNPHPGKWTVYFEDKETGNILTSVTPTEPVNDLQIIESLYYQQKTIA